MRKTSPIRKKEDSSQIQFSMCANNILTEPVILTLENDKEDHINNRNKSPVIPINDTKELLTFRKELIMRMSTINKLDLNLINEKNKEYNTGNLVKFFDAKKDKKQASSAKKVKKSPSNFQTSTKNKDNNIFRMSMINMHTQQMKLNVSKNNKYSPNKSTRNLIEPSNSPSAITIRKLESIFYL